MWMEVAVVAIIFAVGNILMGHWEAQTPKWRRLLKFVVFLGLTLAISAWLGRVWAFSVLGVLGLAVLIIHGWWLPWRHGINGWTGEPKEKYYALRGWKYPPLVLIGSLLALTTPVAAQDGGSSSLRLADPYCPSTASGTFENPNTPRPSWP